VTSADLADRVGLTPRSRVVDLCGGAGATARAVLRHLGKGGHVITVDNAAAMQETGRHLLPDPRVTWVLARAEEVADRVVGLADAVVCNSGIWKTDMPATFAAVRTLLHPGGRFTFNIAGEFAGLPSGSPESDRVDGLIDAIAADEFGYAPSPGYQRPGLLTAPVVRGMLGETGFTSTVTEVVTHKRSLAEKRGWLSLPLFAQPPGQLTYEQRMKILGKAFSGVDMSQPDATSWLVVTAAVPGA
jgi:SAM-dependent methyltransferase